MSFSLFWKYGNISSNNTFFNSFVFIVSFFILLILSAIPSEIYEVSEQYANGGLDLLNSEYVGHEDEFIENFRLNINELNDNDKILNKIKELKL